MVQWIRTTSIFSVQHFSSLFGNINAESETGGILQEKSPPQSAVDNWNTINSTTHGDNSTVNSISSTANNIISTANSISSTSNSISSTASNIISNPNNISSTANTIISNANSISSTANTIISNANSISSTANSIGSNPNLSQAPGERRFSLSGLDTLLNELGRDHSLNNSYNAKETFNIGQDSNTRW